MRTKQRDKKKRGRTVRATKPKFSKKAKDSVRTTELQNRRFLDLIQGLDTIVWEADAATWQFTFVNQRAESILGYPIEQWLTEPDFWAKHIHPEDRQEAVAYCRTATLQGKDHEFEYRAVAADGRVVWLRDIVHVVKDDKGQVQQLRGVMVDITERKQAEEKLQHSLEHIRALQDINFAITSTLDLRAVLEVLFEKIDLFLPYAAVTVRLLNPETQELEPIACWNIDEQEWKAATAVGGGVGRMLAEDNLPVMVRNAQTDPRSLASEFLRKQGLVSYLRVPLTARGEVFGVLTFFTKEEHEFTADEVEFLTILASQAAIAIHNSQLHEQTKKQAVQLEKASKVKDEFLGFVSHELRTPVNAIMGYTDMIKDRILGEISAEQEKALAKVIGRSKNLLGMINSLLEATRVEAGAVKVAMKEVRLGDFLGELRSAYDIPLDKELTLTWDYPSDLPVMKTDREKLRHILENLINNAIKFTERGSVTVTARHLPESKKVAFKVADTGMGIPTESVPSIFEMFRQVDDFNARSPGGFGLGLHIVKKFTEMLAGRIEVESQLGRGSTFTVTIPCSPYT